jgi:hypothetical protein
VVAFIPDSRGPDFGKSFDGRSARCAAHDASGHHGIGSHGISVSALPGSAVGDLQSLQEADELLADFDLLDELAPDQSHASNQN